MGVNKLDRALKRVKLWQEECKLVVLFLSAVGSVWAFVERMVARHPETLKTVSDIAKGIPPGARGEGGGGFTPLAPVRPMIVNSRPPHDWVGLALGTLALVLCWWAYMRLVAYIGRRGSTHAG